MDLTTVTRTYLSEMADLAGPGMKVLLMDNETISVVSMVYAQSEIQQKEVYLFTKLAAQREPMKHLKCITFVRPTEENLALLQDELRHPKYSQYFIFFSNVVSKQDVKYLAEADEHELVREVHEFYADYIPISDDVFSLSLIGCYSANQWKRLALSKTVEGIISVLLSLKCSPQIRYQSNSDPAYKLAEAIRQTISREVSLFDFRRGETSAQLIILDRKDDPVTPLLNQWTYQAMVHELLGITNNRVNLSNVYGIPKELHEVVLSSEHDEFYAKNFAANFGEIGNSIKVLMEDYQRKSHQQAQVESISDMKRFIETYPQFKKLSGTVSKHVAIISELSRLMSTHELLNVSQIEQELACQGEHSKALQEIKTLLHNDRVRVLDKLRLVLLYALRYETHQNNDLHSLVDTLTKKGLPEKYRRMIGYILDYGGERRRSSDLFGTQNAMSITKRFFKGLKGVENIYTQHTPYVHEVLDQLIKGKLRESNYPFIASSDNRERPQAVIVYIIGGVTYEEANAIHNLNKTTAGMRFILGGSTVHNSTSFLEEVAEACGGPVITERDGAMYRMT